MRSPHLGRKTIARAILLLLLAIAWFVAAEPVAAQPVPSRAPNSTHVFPAGARRGSQIPIKVGAECIPPGTRFVVRGTGVRVGRGGELLVQRVADEGEPSPRRLPTETPITYPKQWGSRVAVDGDAPTGIAYWHLSCAQGGTTTRPFVIGDLPEFIETEGNSTPNRAERVGLPVTINGQICGERDLDYFEFQLRKGDLFTCEVLASRLGSKLDPVVSIKDSDGQSLPVARCYRGSDPVIACRASRDDVYRLMIGNVSWHGDPAHVYRLNLTTKPFVQSIFPAGGRPGLTSQFELTLLGSSPTGVKPRNWQCALPADAAGNWTYQTAEFGSSVPIYVSPMARLREPHTETSATQPSNVPVDHWIDGRIEKAGDEDHYAVRVDQAGWLQIVCRADPRTSQALPTLQIKKNAQAAPIQLGPQSPDRAELTHQLQTHAGQLIRLRVRDVRHGTRGGPAFAYSLAVRRLEPAFELELATDVSNIAQGGSGKSALTVTRLGGFDQPVRLSADGLPPGARLEPALIKAGQKQVDVKLHIPDSAPSLSYEVTVVGTADYQGRSISSVATVPFSCVDVEGGYLGTSRLERLLLHVQHKPVFRLFCSEAYLYAHRGSIFPYKMEVERLNGFTGTIRLQQGDRQNRDMDGIEMLEVDIPADKQQVWLPIYLPETMHINVQSQSQLYSQGIARFTDSHGTAQSVLVVSEKRNMLRTLPPVVKMRLVSSELKTLKPGVYECPLRLDRTSNFTGPMRFVLQAAPQGVKIASPVTFQAGQSSGSIRIRVDTQLTRRLRLTVRGLGQLDSNREVTVVTQDQLTIPPASGLPDPRPRGETEGK